MEVTNVANLEAEVRSFSRECKGFPMYVTIISEAGEERGFDYKDSPIERIDAALEGGSEVYIEFRRAYRYEAISEGQPPEIEPEEREYTPPEAAEESDDDGPDIDPETGYSRKWVTGTLALIANFSVRLQHRPQTIAKYRPRDG